MLLSFGNIARSFRYYIQYELVMAMKISLILPLKQERQRRTYYHKLIKNWLSRFLKDVKINKFEISNAKNDGPVWVCWWQGFAEMPSIVKACWQSINQNVKERPVILITKDNYKQYADIPDIIKERLDAGDITLTHFSDILRACLLYKNGGFWFDATIFISLPIDEILDNANFFTLHSPYTNYYVSEGRWCGFTMGGSKGNPLFKYMIEAFTRYWQHYNCLIDYFLIDYVIATAYDMSPQIRRIIDEYALESPKLYILQQSLDKPMSEIQIEIMKTVPVHKLTWKYSNRIARKGSVREWIENSSHNIEYDAQDYSLK